MEEILTQRRAELEIAAKNTIVEIYVIEEQRDGIIDMLNAKKKIVDNINAALRELDHITNVLKTENITDE